VQLPEKEMHLRLNNDQSHDLNMSRIEELRFIRGPPPTFRFTSKDSMSNHRALLNLYGDKYHHDVHSKKNLRELMHQFAHRGCGLARRLSEFEGL
jgi:hypothetical protein